MRQTRRSRSAATPQKEEGAATSDEQRSGEQSAKMKLDVVFEKDGASQEMSDDAANEDQGVDYITEEGSNVQDEADEAGEAGEEETQEETEAEQPSGNAPETDVIKLHCQVCNCSFTNYREHMNSESHKASRNQPNSDADASGVTSPKPVAASPKPVAASPKPVAASPKPVAASPKPSVGQTPKGQAVKRNAGPDGNSAPTPKKMKDKDGNDVAVHYCEVCTVTIVKKKDYDHHLKGRKHKFSLQRAQGKSPCEVCDLVFNTPTELSEHNDSELHKTNFAVKKTTHFCEVCKVYSHGEKQYNQHLVSKRHKKTIGVPVSPASAATPAASTTSAAGTAPAKAPVKSNSTKVVNGQSNDQQKKWLFVCNACSYFTNDDQQLALHVSRPDHKAAAEKMKADGLMCGARFRGGQRKTPFKQFNKPATAASVKPAVPNTGVKQAASNAAPAAISTGAASKVVPFQQKKTGLPIKPAGFQTKVNRRVATIKKNFGLKPNNGAAPALKPILKNATVVNRMPVRAGAIVKQGGNFNSTNRRPNNPNFGASNGNQNPQGGYGLPPMAGPSSGGPPMRGQSAGGPGPQMRGGYGSYGPGNFNNDMRNDMPRNDMRNDMPRNDFRTDMRGDYQGTMRGDYRDVRDMRTDMVRSDMPGDYRGDMRADMRNDSRGDIRNDVRGDMRDGVRSNMHSDSGADYRGYGSGSGSGDLRRDDYRVERSSLGGYGGNQSTGFSSLGAGYRGNMDDYRSSGSYGSGGQMSSMGASSGYMASGRFDSFQERSLSSDAYRSQYGNAPRSTGYMGSMSLNGR